MLCDNKSWHTWPFCAVVKPSCEDNDNGSGDELNLSVSPQVIANASAYGSCNLKLGHE